MHLDLWDGSISHCDPDNIPRNKPGSSAPMLSSRSPAARGAASAGANHGNDVARTLDDDGMIDHARPDGMVDSHGSRWGYGFSVMHTREWQRVAPRLREVVSPVGQIVCPQTDHVLRAALAPPCHRRARCGVPLQERFELWRGLRSRAASRIGRVPKPLFCSTLIPHRSPRH